jgi:hypothetical protein
MHSTPAHSTTDPCTTMCMLSVTAGKVRQPTTAASITATRRDKRTTEADNSKLPAACVYHCAQHVVNSPTAQPSCSACSLHLVFSYCCSSIKSDAAHEQHSSLKGCSFPPITNCLGSSADVCCLAEHYTRNTATCQPSSPPCMVIKSSQ